MKKLPEEDLWNDLKRRLGGYTREPEDEVWEKIATALPKNPPSKGLSWKNQIAGSTLLLLFAFLTYLLYEYKGESQTQASAAKIIASSPMVTEQPESTIGHDASEDNTSQKTGNEAPDESGKITANSSVTKDLMHNDSETTDTNNSQPAFSSKGTTKRSQDNADRYGKKKVLVRPEASNSSASKITKGSVFTSSDELPENNGSALMNQKNVESIHVMGSNANDKNKVTTSNTSKLDLNSDASSELETISSMKDRDENERLQSATVITSLSPDSTNRSNDNIHPGNVNRSSGEMQSSSLSKVDADAQEINKAIVDSIVAEGKGVTKKSNAIRTKSEKQKTPDRKFCFAITPSLAFAKIKPFLGDAEDITNLHSPAIFSKERFGFSIDAGIQRPLGKHVELYAGLSLYRQSQHITYEYETPEIEVLTDGGGGYTISPTTVTIVSEFDYKMFNVGFSTGLYYRIHGDKFMHKAGIGMQYQQGMLKASSEMSYDNAQSSYLNYQVSYRIEFVMNGKLNLYLQPTFTHAIRTNEKLSEPLSVVPYRAGISFGILLPF